MFLLFFLLTILSFLLLISLISIILFSSYPTFLPPLSIFFLSINIIDSCCFTATSLLLNYCLIEHRFFMRFLRSITFPNIWHLPSFKLSNYHHLSSSLRHPSRIALIRKGSFMVEVVTCENPLTMLSYGGFFFFRSLSSSFMLH